MAAFNTEVRHTIKTPHTIWMTTVPRKTEDSKELSSTASEDGIKPIGLMLQETNMFVDLRQKQQCRQGKSCGSVVEKMLDK